MLGSKGKRGEIQIVIRKIFVEKMTFGKDLIREIRMLILWPLSHLIHSTTRFYDYLHFIHEEWRIEKLNI